MKRNIFLSVIILVFLTACSTTKTSNDVSEYSYDDSYEYSKQDVSDIKKIAPKMTDDFLGDFNTIKLEDLMFLVKSKNTVKPKELKSIMLVPRNNTVEFSYRDLANSICFSLNKAERTKIIGACETFLQQYEEKTIPHHKVNAKTAYVNSYCHLWFGVTGPSNECSRQEYYVNCEFIDKRPYLLIQFVPSRCDTIDGFTPSSTLYMSPSQIRDFIEVMNQENLNALVQNLNEKAYTY